jgi:hypothetical protein
MYYKAFTDAADERSSVIWFSDERSPGEIGAALVDDGYLLVMRGEAAWAGVNVGGVTMQHFEFTPIAQTVLLSGHVIRIDVVVPESPTE